MAIVNTMMRFAGRRGGFEKEGLRTRMRTWQACTLGGNANLAVQPSAPFPPSTVRPSCFLSYTWRKKSYASCRYILAHMCVCICVWYVDPGLARMVVRAQTMPRSDGLEMIYWPVGEMFSHYFPPLVHLQKS